MRALPAVLAYFCLVTGQDSCQDGPDEEGAFLQLSAKDAFKGRARCLLEYGKAVEPFLPGFTRHLTARQWGGPSEALMHPAPPVLVAGFDLAGRWSLAAFAKQYGLSVTHKKPGIASDLLLMKDISTLNRPFGGFAGCTEALNKVNFAQAFEGQYRLVADNLLRHHFLDFYALSPDSKVVLLKEPQRNTTARNMLAPVEASCGQSLKELSKEDKGELLKAHTSLMRCMVPKGKLLELDAQDSDDVDVAKLAKFLGLHPPRWDAPFPRMRLPERHRMQLQMENKPTNHLRDKTLAVCITGQLRRLELHSKIRNLLKPAEAAGMNVRVVAVIDPAMNAVYVHGAREPGTHLGTNVTIINGPYSTLRAVHKAFSNTSSVVVDAFRPTLYQVDVRYLKELGKNGGDSQTRAKSHVKQWQALHRCWELIQDLHPDYTIRLRDDDIVYHPWLPNGNASTLVVPDCASFGGLNDKGALAIGATVAQKYLTAPLQKGVFNFNEVYRLHRLSLTVDPKPRPLRPERLLKFVMELENVSVSKVGMHRAPFLPGHFIRRGQKDYVCYFYAMQDCLTKQKVSALNRTGLQFGGPQSNGTRDRWICEASAYSLLTI